MPPRNLVIAFLVIITSVVCYTHALRNHYASLISEAMHIIDERSLEKVSERELFISAMNGMVGSLDEHSMFMSDLDYSRFNDRIDQRLVGIGIQVAYDDEHQHVKVDYPFYDSPAYNAGLRSGDLITEVNGTETFKKNTSDVVTLIKGEVGEAVKLKVVRLEPPKEFEVEIVREEIKVPSVEGDTRNPDGTWNFVLEEDPRIGYVRLSQFGKHSYSEMQRVITSLNGKIDSLIIDLRFNPGGSLDSVIKICDMFIESGEIVSTKGRDQKVIEAAFATTDLLVPKDVRVVVMVNRHSASASEILAACLQDHQRAIVVGERSYGKGTVQNVIELESGKSQIKLTTASFWRPSGRNIHRLKDATEDKDWGVIPDPGFSIPVDEEEMAKVFRYSRSRTTQKTDDASEPVVEPVEDRQLRAAVDYLKEQRKSPQAA
jgi:carboxyl-terminal processing protease